MNQGKHIYDFSDMQTPPWLRNPSWQDRHWPLDQSAQFRKLHPPFSLTYSDLHTRHECYPYRIQPSISQIPPLSR